jgi:hypothetical protein
MEFGEGMVFGLGLPRTGTTSLAAAGEILGYRAIHTNVAMAQGIGVGNFSTENMRGFNFFSDEPYCALWKLFYGIFPKAKFILTTRDLHSWLDSIRYMFSAHLPYWDENIRKFQLKIWGITPAFWEGKADDDFLMKWYFGHHARVLDGIPRKKLLVLRLEEENKWEKLCAFLGKALPDVAYPDMNKEV